MLRLKYFKLEWNFKFSSLKLSATGWLSEESREKRDSGMRGEAEGRYTSCLGGDRTCPLLWLTTVHDSA